MGGKVSVHSATLSDDKIYIDKLLQVQKDHRIKNLKKNAKENNNVINLPV